MQEDLNDDFDCDIDYDHHNENPEDNLFDTFVEKLQEIVLEPEFESL